MVMRTKLILAAMAAGLALGLSACASERGIPYSATDCARAARLPKHWSPSAGNWCQHFKPRWHSHGQWRQPA